MSHDYRCDHPDPCACYAEGYAAGNERAHWEVRNAGLGTHDAGCSCDARVSAAGSWRSGWRAWRRPSVRRTATSTRSSRPGSGSGASAGSWTRGSRPRGLRKSKVVPACAGVDRCRPRSETSHVPGLLAIPVRPTGSPTRPGPRMLGPCLSDLRLPALFRHRVPRRLQGQCWSCWRLRLPDCRLGKLTAMTQAAPMPAATGR